MSLVLFLVSLVVVLGAAGTYLLLPHRHGSRSPRNVHAAGIALGVLAALALEFTLNAPGPFVLSLFFYAFGLGAVVGSILMVTSRDPIHSALWFAGVVISTTGLFLLSGAQFLAAGTVIVYAGAIIVTFLFVIMLAQMEGRAAYDRAARAPFQATFTCFVLLLGLLWSLIQVPLPTAGAGQTNGTPLVSTEKIASLADRTAAASVNEVIARSVRPTARLADASGRLKPHVAGLGETLYTDHLITIELAGGLLFVALVAAISIAAPKPPVRPAAVVAGAKAP